MKSLVFFLLLSPAVVDACTCGYTEYFCNYATSYLEWTEGRTAVVRARFLAFRTPDVEGYAPLYDWEILDVLTGDATVGERITLWGQDGGNCNGPRFHNASLRLHAGREYVLLYPTEEGYTSYYPGLQEGIPNPYPIHDFPGCGPSVLPIEGDRVRGKLTPDSHHLPLAELDDKLRDCLGDTYVPPDRPFDGFTALEVKLTPNPAIGQLTISFDEARIFDVDLYDAGGRRVYRARLGGASVRSHEIDVTELPAGVYILVMGTESLRVKKQFVVWN